MHKYPSFGYTIPNSSSYHVMNLVNFKKGSKKKKINGIGSIFHLGERSDSK
jgi:hypothetical protein